MSPRERLAEWLLPLSNDTYGIADCEEAADMIMDMIDDKYGHLLEKDNAN